MNYGTMELSVRGCAIACLLLVGVSGCGDNESPEPERDAGKVPPKAMDASMDAAPTENELPTVPIIDAGFVFPDAGALACGLNVGVQCDGDEDCSGGQLCCGTYDQATLRYTSIMCADSCSGASERKLCHPDETCPNTAYVCRRSQLLPFDFVSVCSTPGTGVAAQRGASVAGQVHCGTASCTLGAEQCCLRARVGMLPMQGMPLEPYCAPVSEACACEYGTPSDDAGADDAG